MSDDSRMQRIREHPASPASRELLSQVLAGVIRDVPAMTSTDIPRLRALARLLSDVAPYQPAVQRAAAKEGAARTDAVADFLAELGETARQLGGW